MFNIFIDNIIKCRIYAKRCEFARLSRTLEPPPKLLYFVVHVVLGALELLRKYVAPCVKCCSRKLEFF